MNAGYRQLSRLELDSVDVSLPTTGQTVSHNTVIQNSSSFFEGGEEVGMEAADPPKHCK